MTEREDFVGWVQSVLKGAEVAVHNGDAGPRRRIWSRKEPVSVLGAFTDAVGHQSWVLR
jgi:hypothetical protein